MTLGDFALESTIYHKFTTRRFTTGAPFTLAGTPAVSAYEDDSTTEITAGITLVADFDSRTGLNHLTIAATAANGFEAGKTYCLVITTGTVDSVSVVGEIIGYFTIEKVAALRPTTAARTLDVTATGAAGIDWGNVENPTTANNLSSTNIDTDQVVASVTGAVGSVTAGVTVTTNNDKTGYSLSAAAIQAIWDALTAALTTVGSIGKLLVDNINATISSRLASADITLTGGAVTVGTNNDKTGYSIGVGGIAANSFAAGAIDAAALAQSAGQEIADEFLDRDLVGGASGNTRGVRNALRTLRNRTSIATGGAVNVYEEDDTTVAWSGTATRDAAAEPITQIDPA